MKITKKIIDTVTSQKEELVSRLIPKLPRPTSTGSGKHPDIYVVLKEEDNMEKFIEGIGKLPISLERHKDILKKLKEEFYYLNEKDIELAVRFFWKQFLYELLMGKCIRLPFIGAFRLDFRIFNIYKKWGTCITVFETSKFLKTLNVLEVRKKCIELYGEKFYEKIPSLKRFYERSEIESVTDE